MTRYDYQAVLVRQTATSAGIVLFGAPASQIEEWGGVPQKRQLGGADFGETETTGFQRELNAHRLDNLVDFYSEPANVVQNPLLCASREGPGGSTTFTPHGDTTGFLVPGTVTITEDGLNQRPLRDLFRMVREQLEKRVPELAERQVDELRLASLREAAAHIAGREDWLPTDDGDPTEVDGLPEEEGIESADEVAAIIEDLCRGGNYADGRVRPCLEALPGPAS